MGLSQGGSGGWVPPGERRKAGGSGGSSPRANTSFGWIATAAYTSSCSAAHAADQREDSRVVPTVTIRAIPAARAAATTPATGRSIMSR